jgi:hypothetical protein
MTQNPKLLALGLAGGYLLGRTRKAKVALAVASYVVGKRAGISPQQLLTEGLRKLSDTPEFARLEKQVRDELMSAGRSMVTAAANRRLDSLSDVLRDRTEALSAPGEGAGQEQPGERDETAQTASEGGEPESSEPESAQPDEEPAAGKEPSGKAAPEQGDAKKRPAGQPAAEKTAAKKSTQRRSATKKTASRATGRR